MFIHDESMVDENSMDPLDSTKSTNDVSTNDFPTIVDAFTLNEEPNIEAPHVYYEIISLDDDEQKTEISSEPILEMLPLTIALMKRKSLHYMGLQADRFSRLLELARTRKSFTEIKIMLTLRKLRLKEDFETLGDLFDLDKTTTEKYFNQTKYRVAELYMRLSSPYRQPHI